MQAEQSHIAPRPPAVSSARHLNPGSPMQGIFSEAGDVYALGMVVWEMAHQRRAWGGKALDSIAKAVMRHRQPLFQERLPERLTVRAEAQAFSPTSAELALVLRGVLNPCNLLTRACEALRASPAQLQMPGMSLVSVDSFLARCASTRHHGVTDEWGCPAVADATTLAMQHEPSEAVPLWVSRGRTDSPPAADLRLVWLPHVLALDLYLRLSAFALSQVPIEAGLQARYAERQLSVPVFEGAAQASWSAAT